MCLAAYSIRSFIITSVIYSIFIIDTFDIISIILNNSQLNKILDILQSQTMFQDKRDYHIKKAINCIIINDLYD